MSSHRQRCFYFIVVTSPLCPRDQRSVTQSQHLHHTHTRPKTLTPSNSHSTSEFRPFGTPASPLITVTHATQTPGSHRIPHRHLVSYSWSLEITFLTTDTRAPFHAQYSGYSQPSLSHQLQSHTVTPSLFKNLRSQDSNHFDPSAWYSRYTLRSSGVPPSLSPQTTPHKIAQVYNATRQRRLYRYENERIFIHKRVQVRSTPYTFGKIMLYYNYNSVLKVHNQILVNS